MQMKTLGPPFGSDLGRGLALREGPPVQAPQVQDSPSPPQILQVHELVVYPPPCKRLRETLDSRLEVHLMIHRLSWRLTVSTGGSLSLLEVHCLYWRFTVSTGGSLSLLEGHCLYWRFTVSTGGSLSLLEVHCL